MYLRPIFYLYFKYTVFCLYYITRPDPSGFVEGPQNNSYNYWIIHFPVGASWSNCNAIMYWLHLRTSAIL
jgi:hypothetical protein